MKFWLKRGKQAKLIFGGAIEEGLGTARFQSNASAQGMLKIAQLAEKLQARGPRDLSENLDKYLWDNNQSTSEESWLRKLSLPPSEEELNYEIKVSS